MVYYPPSWVPKLPCDPPDSVTIWEFMTDEKTGRHPLAKSRNPLTCGLSGKTYTVTEQIQRTDHLSRALAKRMGWAPNEDTAWDKVIGVFSLNTIDYLAVLHAVHRLSGIATPANAAYSAAELQHQLTSSGAKALFTCVPLLETAVKAANAAGIPNDKVFILGMHGFDNVASFASVDHLIAEGERLPELEALKWTKGQGARQPAFLCYSSGTSGLPKAVMISHHNVIANVIQYRLHEEAGRKAAGVTTSVMLGLLPFSHIYALVLALHGGGWRGDEVIVLPKFDFKTLLGSIQKYKIEQLLMVPPIIIRLLTDQEVARKYDLSSVRWVFVGAAPLGAETAAAMKKIYPTWRVGQGYGMTETATVVVATSELDIMVGSSGSLLPGCRAKVIDMNGNEVTEYEKRGELYIDSPSVVLGYLNNEKATAETFVYHEDGRWIRTGDEVVVTKAPSGHEHFTVVDRIKELIKVKGFQVAPAELESHLLAHPAVADCAVIQIPDDRAGEVPKAYVVRAPSHAKNPEADLAREIAKHVEDHKADYKWLKGGVEFIDVIPKSPSGKILRRMLRDKEKADRKKKGAKL